MLRNGIFRPFISQRLCHVLAGKHIRKIVIYDPHLAEFCILGNLQRPVSVIVLHVILRPFLRIKKGNVLRFL